MQWKTIFSVKVLQRLLFIGAPVECMCVESVSFDFKRILINAGEGVEKREPSYTVGGNAN